MPVARQLAIAVALVAGCGDGDRLPVADAGPPAVELGTGDTTFEPLADGGNIFIVQGPQGGFHFFGSIRAGGIDPGNPDDLADPRNPTTTFRVFVGADRVDLDAASYTQGLDFGAPGQFEMVGRLVVLDIGADDELDGTEVRFEVEVVDADGLRATDSRTLTALPHPANP